MWILAHYEWITVKRVDQKTVVCLYNGILMQIPAHGGTRVLWQQWTNSNGLPSPVEEKGQQGTELHGHSLKGTAPHPYLDRLLLLFWAHYIEDGPHLLCTGSL